MTNDKIDFEKLAVLSAVSWIAFFLAPAKYRVWTVAATYVLWGLWVYKK